MKSRICLLALILGLAAATIQVPAQNTPLPNRNNRLPVERRVADLLSRMTVEEKAAQLRCMLPAGDWREFLGPDGLGGAGPVLRPFAARQAAMLADSIQDYAIAHSRLKIPLLIHDESLHGLVANGATCFPQAIGLAATWDTLLVGRVATAIGRETRARGIRQVLAPVINIARDARWGRVEETYGEDPCLTSRMGVAYCRAIEHEGVITTPKHFAANVGDGGRDSYPVYFSERILREVYFPAFKACIQEAGAGSVMAAYNSLDGVACSANPWLLTNILRKEWGFNGIVVSDYGSTHGIMSMHHNTATEEETAARAVDAGLDMELPHISIYGKPLLAAVASGALPKKALDAAAANVLRTKFRLGLFDDPHVDPAAAEKINRAPEHLALAREAAAKSLVLLKNENGLLPLRRDLRSIAVIGPAADTLLTGGYSGWGFERVSLKRRSRNFFPPAPHGPQSALRKAATSASVPSSRFLPLSSPPRKENPPGMACGASITRTWSFAGNRRSCASIRR
jgi:beta-glucosidase